MLEELQLEIGYCRLMEALLRVKREQKANERGFSLLFYCSGC
jgi:hypothetical protein